MEKSHGRLNGSPYLDNGNVAAYRISGRIAQFLCLACRGSADFDATN